MEFLYTDEQKKQELSSIATKTCARLNSVVFPVCRAMGVSFDKSDMVSIRRYYESLEEIKNDYGRRLLQGEADPMRVAKTLDEIGKRWGEALVRNPYNSSVRSAPVNAHFPDEIISYIRILGSDFSNYKADFDSKAITADCAIFADEADSAKKKEIEDACNMLNKVFNGNAQLFPGYIAIVQGQFAPLKYVKTYKPLINAE